jgi:predicted DNA-binding transcriptional regulator YafY
VRRADRLFELVQRLRRARPRATTARALAAALEVSERTIYRDIEDLSLQGVPIRGEAGVGYVLERGYELPPLMFDEDEIEALVLGARVVRGWGDPALAAAAADALAKIESGLPEPLRERVAGAALFALNLRPRREDGERLTTLRHAVRARNRVTFAYRDAQGQASERTVQPLGLFYWGETWTLGAWCELRENFRNFRVDRIEHLAVGSGFPWVPGRTLEDLFRFYRDDVE